MEIRASENLFVREQVSTTLQEQPQKNESVTAVKLAKGQMQKKEDLASSQRRSLEEIAVRLAEPDRISMTYGNPNSELFLAWIARAVVFVVSGRTTNPDESNPLQCADLTLKNSDLSTLLSVREERV